MFGNFSFAASPYTFKQDKTSLPQSHASKKEALVLTFPGLSLDDKDAPPDPLFRTSGDPSEFKKRISKIKRLIDIKPEHLQNMNLKLSTECSIDDLIPTDTLHPETPSERSKKLLEFFEERERELSISNEDGSASLARIRRDIKLGHMYRFFQSVELVVTYFTKDGASTGMPERFREELLKNFLEPLGWAWGLRYIAPREPPKVAFGSSLFQARLDLISFLPPTLPEERKSGVALGPLFGVQNRHDEYFTYPGCPPPPRPATPPPSAQPPKPETTGTTPPPSKRVRSSSSRSKKPKPAAPVDELTGSTDEKTVDPRNLAYLRRAKGSFPEGDVWDTTRELGALLHIAQQRRRARKNPGEMVGKTRLTVYGSTDDRGAGPNGWWDEVFLISSVHSHIGFTRARVSQAYLRFLETGEWPNPEHPLIKEGSAWAGIEVERSKWFNLLDTKERVEAMWAVARVVERSAGKVDLA